MATKITDFFAQSKNLKEIETDSEKNPEKICEQFYENCLFNQKKCQSKTCDEQKSIFQNKINDLEKKCMSYEQAIQLCESVLKEKDAKIANLRKNIETTTETTSSETVSNLNKNSANFTSNVPKKLTFDEYVNEFSEQELAKLRSIGDVSREDPKFISTAMKFLYANRLFCLKNKSITGRSRYGPKKDIVTPEKMTILRKIFDERIGMMTNDDEERDVRKKKLNKHIKDALATISRSEEANSTATEIAHNLFSN